jgi:hypothetical protein
MFMCVSVSFCQKNVKKIKDLSGFFLTWHPGQNQKEKEKEK